MQQANLYFERCYAADRDPLRTDDERSACWQAWSTHYEIGQPQDRLDYAHERLVMLDPRQGTAITLATGDLGEMVALGEGAPVPETETEAPASVVPEGPELSDTLRPRRARAPRRASPPRTLTSECARECDPSFQACSTQCAPADRACTDACRHRFWQCARGCY